MNCKSICAIWRYKARWRSGPSRRVLNLPGMRFDVDSWSPLFYVFRHYYGKGAHLGKSFRARDG